MLVNTIDFQSLRQRQLSVARDTTSKFLILDAETNGINHKVFLLGDPLAPTQTANLPPLWNSDSEIP